MIRLVLEPGPQRGSDVWRWVAEASGYQRSKVLDVAKRMEARGELWRGLWALEKSPLSSISESLKARIEASEPATAPLVPPGEVLTEMIFDELRELMGDS